jgi:hypothetical protein
MTTRRTIGVALAGLALLAGATVAPAPPAGADNGDNRPGCVRGEICFWYDSLDMYQKQFWWTADHGGNNFMYWDQVNYLISRFPVQDDALEATNWDTECRVRVGDLSHGTWAWTYLDNDGQRTFLGAINNRNDRHERCV